MWSLDRTGFDLRLEMGLEYKFRWNLGDHGRGAHYVLQGEKGRVAMGRTTLSQTGKGGSTGSSCHGVRHWEFSGVGHGSLGKVGTREQGQGTSTKLHLATVSVSAVSMRTSASSTSRIASVSGV